MSVKPVNVEIPMQKAVAELKRRHGIGENVVCESVLNEFPELRENRVSVLELLRCGVSSELAHKVRARLDIAFP